MGNWNRSLFNKFMAFKYVIDFDPPNGEQDEVLFVIIR